MSDRYQVRESSNGWSVEDTTVGVRYGLYAQKHDADLNAKLQNRADNRENGNDNE